MRAMGIDLGTTTASIIIMDAGSGEILGSKTIAHNAFLEGHVPQSKIQDAKKLFALVESAVNELSDEFGVPDCIGLTGQMHGMLYVDENGEAVSPVYIWQDGCGNFKMEDGRSYAEALRETGGAASTGFGLTSHFYLQKNGMIPADAVKMATISDYIGMKLCGRKEPVIAKDMAASWGCFDLKNGKFLIEEMEKVGVDTSYLPELLDKHEVMGHTVGNVPNGVPVIASLGDNQASVLGSVQDLCETVLINIGTGSQVSVGTAEFYDVSGSIELRPCVGDNAILVGSGLCGGRAYAMLEKFYREVTGSDDAMYGIMAAQAADFKEKSGTSEAWKVKTTFSGTRSNPDMRGSIANIGVENFHPGAMTVGMIQGILDELHEMYESMCEATGKKATKLVGSGNGIRKNKLMQELAEEMYGMKIEIPLYQEEAAYGAALYSLVAAGHEEDFSEVQKKIKYC